MGFTSADKNMLYQPSNEPRSEGAESPAERSHGTSFPDGNGAGKPAGADGGAAKIAGAELSNLTQGQLKIWMAQQLLPESPVYHLAVALNIRGEIDPVCLGKAFQTLVNSSDALRTVVEDFDGIPMQRVLAALPYDVADVDLSRQTDPRAAATSWMKDRCGRPLNWQRCLFDSALLKLSRDEFIWYLNVHHMICDGWSFELIYRHMADLYRRALEGTLPPTDSLFPYTDYIAHERSHRQSARQSRSEAFWKQRLAEGGEEIEFYGKRPLKTTAEVRRISWDLGAERTRKLRATVPQAPSDTEQSSLLQAFAAVLVAYLHCLNGKSKYAIGIPFHNRRAKSFKETIGFFTEVLPVFLEVSEDDSFLSLMAKVKAEVFRAVRHGQYSLANSNFQRLYEVVANYHTRSFSEFAGMPADPQWIFNGQGDDSLAIQIRDFTASSSLSVDFDLHREVFDERDGDRAVDHFSRVLDAFLTTPEQPLRYLSVISPEEAETVLRWSDGGFAPMDSRPVYQLIDEQVRERPDAVAVAFEEQRLTYRELNWRANRVAHYLQERGAGRETRVGLYVDRSIEMVVGLLGILKAGAAYVPIHTEYSPEWLRFLLEETGMPLLLTQEALLCRLPAGRTEIVALDRDSEFISRQSEENLDSGSTVHDLAYVIYTSGSTGMPKGVEVPHGALTNFTQQAGKVFDIGPADRVLQFASLAFDTSAEEIFPCLIRGATLVLRSDAMLASASVFLEQCAEWDISVLDLPTAYWHDLTAAIHADRLRLPPSVRLVVIGGERALADRLALWQACVDRQVRLLNTYGPTEATVAAAVYDLTDYPAATERFAELPIGKPMPNIQTYVLDRNMRPVPIGVAGELYIAGAGLARGYLNQPAVSAEKFLRNPFSPEPESRVYKTGDVARYRPDGNLEYLGRSDRQIKIRGYRIELDGIEAVLRGHPLVKNAAVLQYGNSNQNRLIAYLAPHEGAALNEAEIRSFAREKLPEYMVPEKVVVLESLPLTHSGKVDRRALPSPEDGSPAPSRIVEPPRTATETRIAEIWRRVLGVESVGRSDHFFEIGGQSLVAAQIVSRISKDMGIKIPLRLIFEAPTVAELSERIDQIPRPEEEFVDKAPLTPAQRGDQAPLSQSQARIWYMHQLAPESSAYNMAAPIRFTGVLHKDALARALDVIVCRHESLRTTFRSIDGTPVQIVAPQMKISLPETDLRELAEDRRVPEARRILSDEARRPFDLEAGPLIRVLLLRLAHNDQILLLNMHHVISDQWSLGVLARELVSLYNSFCSGVHPTSNDPQPQYADFALWEDRQLNQELSDHHLAYWKKQLADLEPLNLPADRPRPTVQTFRGSYQSIGLPPELVSNLARHASSERATLYMIFLAAFKALLCRYCGQQDIALGSPVANRNHIDWERIIGTFINIVVLRTDLSGNPSLREVLRRVREVALDAFNHQKMSFEQLVKELQPERDPSRSPLVQVLFNFQSVPLHAEPLQGLSWSPFEIEQHSSQFDLSVTVDPEITRKIVISYNTDLFDGDTICRMLGHYRRLLESLVENFDQSILTVPILDDEERRLMISEWNDTEVSVPEVCVHEMFEAQTHRTPAAIAMEFENQRFSYGELNSRANQAAASLRTRGVGPGVLVGVCLERSPDLIAALLGVWKAGGAYVPIDPAYPAERIAFMLEDSGMAVLLTQEKLLSRLPKNGHQTLCMDGIGREATSEEVEVLRSNQPSDLAYVIYTSGSTGKPKGVAVEHRSLVNFLHSMSKNPGITERDVLLSVTTISFDIAALELFLPLLAGARVVLTNRETAADGRRLMQELARSGATLMQATPTTWRMLTDAGWKGFRGFKVLCGGEAFPPDLVPLLLDKGNTVWNLYGPTETTVWSTAFQVNASSGLVSVGRPIDNTRLYILDPNMEPVPIGVPGELYIGGQGVARGYWQRPELTAEKFVRDPYCADAGARLFKTGDLARYRPDGNVECLGRIDQQLKIRGHRIEPGEVEAALSEHPAVRQAIVVGREQEPGEKQLVAYLLTRHDSELDGEALRSFLARKLPDYMLPSAYVFLEAMPVAPGGKVNRQALPPPDPSSSQPLKIFIPPRDRLEFQLLQIWQSVLHVKPIGARDSFFGLGGHSLTTVRLITEIKKQLGVDLPIATLFSAPTIERLAKVIRAQGWIPPRNCLIEIKPQGSKSPLFLIGGGYELAAYFEPDQPVYGLSFVGMFEKEITPTSIREIATGYIESIRSIQPEGPYYLAGYSAGGIIAFEMAQLLDSQGEKAGLVALLDTYGPQSRRVPLWRILRAHWRAFSERERRARLDYARHVWKRTASFVGLPVRRAVWRLFHRAFLSGGAVPLTSENLTMAYDLAFRNYAAKVYPGPGVLVRSSEAKAGFHDARDRGWTAMFAGGLEIHDLPSDHWSMFDEPHVRRVAECLGECLRRAQI
jgi:amino acid adenylation domain-containing protein